MDDSFQVAASWYDGRSAVRHEGHARWEERVAWLALSDDLPKESR